MKRVFTLGILFLLSMVATNFASAKTPLKSATATTDLDVPEFSSDDDSNEIWYYIRFGRRATENLVWTTDFPTNNNSWAIKQLAKKTTDKTTQHWKLVGDAESFFIVNRATGFKVQYAASADAEKGIRGDNYIVGADGGAGVSLKLYPSKGGVGTTWTWTGALDWVIVNPAISATAFMNDRASNTAFPWRDVCYYGYADDGFRIQFVYAEKQAIVVPVDSLSMETLIGHEGKFAYNGISNFNMEDNITATIEGSDAQSFSFFENKNIPSAGNEGSLNIVFSPQENRVYNATLVLTGGTAAPVRIRLIGNGISAEEMPKISSEDKSDEHWYYIQFYRQSAKEVVWSLSDTTLMIVQDTLKATNIRDDQQWKIVGEWEEGYYLVNKTGVEIAYNATASEGKPASRYVQVASQAGTPFNFVRFGATQDWQFYDGSAAITSTTSKYINDSGGKHLTNYSLNDAGNRLIFIPADEPLISTNIDTLAFEVLENESITKSLPIYGLNLTGNITASISGADQSVFTFGESGSTLPAIGGTLNITFSPLTVKKHSATLTLTSGTTTLTIPLAGNSDLGLPIISTPGNDVWYYIQFNRKSTLAWSAFPVADNRYDTPVMQKAKTEQNADQHWKFVGNGTDGYRIINKNGGAVSYDSINTGRILLIEDEGLGDRLLFVRSTTGAWQLRETENYEEVTYSYLNDYGGVNGDGSVGLYIANDGGNYLIFTRVSGTGINGPSFEANDNEKVIAVKYYTLMGQEVVRPTSNGVYIVRKTYVSGRVKATKQLFIIK